MVERWTKRNDTKFANTLPLILIFKCGTTTRRIFYRNYTYKNIRSSNVYFKHARYRTFYTLVTHPPSFYNWIILTDRWIVITKSLYIFAYIKSDTVVLKWSCKKKKNLPSEGTTNKTWSSRGEFLPSPCSSSKDPLWKVFRDLRVFLEGSQTVTKSSWSIGEILSGTSGGFRSLFRIEIKTVTSACNSARRKMEMGLGVGRGVSRRNGEEVERAAERVCKV